MYNNIPNNIALNKMFTIATFYRFIGLENYEDMQPIIKDFCLNNGIKGTILLAAEGINATISGVERAIDDFFAFMNTDERLADLEWKASYASYQPFARTKIRLKKEIVALGVDDLDMNNVGYYVKPEEWDDFIKRDDVTLIDTRNEYEIKLGKFKGAINPHTENFRDLPDWVQNNKLNAKRKIAMYCTGGVRCEKSTAYMKQLGFPEVYHLEGGILNYFEKTGNPNGVWEGDCFVFDDRVALNDKLAPSDSVKCVVCNNYASTDDLKSVPKGKVICSNCKDG